MIPVQKHFPPELVRRWRKVMHDDAIEVRRRYDAEWIVKQLDDPAECERLKNMGYNLDELRMMAKRAMTPKQNDFFAAWKRTQDRDRWIFNVIGACVIGVVIFVVAGGCR